VYKFHTSGPSGPPVRTTGASAYYKPPDREGKAEEAMKGKIGGMEEVGFDLAVRCE